MTLRPLMSTIFPYTTLFGCPDQAADIAAEVAVFAADAARLRQRQRDADGHRERAGGNGIEDRAPAERGLEQADRKSTRLNSSHVEISYAVFCLKKKITTHST